MPYKIVFTECTPFVTITFMSERLVQILNTYKLMTDDNSVPAEMKRVGWQV